MADFTCNLLILGQTGTGKSSLLNYVFGTDFEAGAGSPVTGQGIFEREASIDDQKIRVFDSWGLEAGKLEIWKEEINNAINKHGPDKPMEEWFHTVIYCIQAGSARVQDIDIELIKMFIEEGYRVSIVLTKADQLNDDEREIMVKTIRDELTEIDNKNIYKSDINVIPASVTYKKLRDGTEVIPYGKEDIIKLILENWRKTVINIMPDHILSKVNEEIDKWVKEEQVIIEKNDFAGYDWANYHKKYLQEISERSKVFFTNLADNVLPQFIHDDLINCQKVDLILKDITSTNITIEIPEYYNKTNAVWNVVKEILENLALIPLIAKVIMTFSNKNIEKEKAKLKNEISNMGCTIKKSFKDQRSSISKCIADALGIETNDL